MRKLLILWMTVMVIPIFIGLIFCSNKSEPNRLFYKEEAVKITYLDVNKNKTEEVLLEEYLVGVVAAEMPAEYHIEALKAQAVAARSYILKKTETVNPDHNDAVVCNDPKHCKGHINEDKLLEMWNDKNEDEDLKKIKMAVRETKGEYMIYEGETVEAFFFSRSGGKTENSEDVWGEKRGYLKSVNSENDLLHPEAYEERVLPNAQVREKLFNTSDKIKKGDMALDIAVISRTEGGAVNELSVEGQHFKGTDIRKIFGLKSANFTVTTTKSEVVFKTAGYGHGVGMSQYGANYMAENGKKYTEILHHYYSNVQIVGG